MAIKARLGRFCALICACLLLLELTGCASIFDKSYLYYEPVQQTPPPSAPHSAGDAVEVANFTSLKLALGRMVSAHDEAGIVSFRSYTGDVTSDLAAAVREVSTGTALGSYCVDYIQYELDRIVSYYEAKISVIYKRTAEEISAVKAVGGALGMYSAVEAAMREFTPRCAFSVSAAGVGADDVEDCVGRVYLAYPELFPIEPRAKVELYSGGIQHIFELELDYGAPPEALDSMRLELIDAADGLLSDIIDAGEESHAEKALAAAILLTQSCVKDRSAGNTAWNALVEGESDCGGIALAYKLLCDRLDVDCTVVVGRLEKRLHWWNIIGLDGEYYHADISRAAELGIADTFLRSDADMLGAYWWDNQSYPPCAGELSYADLVHEETPPKPKPPEESPPPEITPSPEPTHTDTPTEPPETTPPEPIETPTPTPPEEEITPEPDTGTGSEG